jgi:hypothetical protein
MTGPVVRLEFEGVISTVGLGNWRGREERSGVMALTE